MGTRSTQLCSAREATVGDITYGLIATARNPGNDEPFAYNNVNYPAADPAKKNMGGRHIVTSALAPKGDVSKVTVKPNPYKRAALFDNRSQVYEHKIVFSNLPPLAKITILDVSGQVIDVINFSSNDPSNGSVFWDMFSKDGIEVASGVYIYVVETPTSSTLGHFAILR